jgi:hypothetical protein
MGEAMSLGTALHSVLDDWEGYPDDDDTKRLYTALLGLQEHGKVLVELLQKGQCEEEDVKSIMGVLLGLKDDDDGGDDDDDDADVVDEIAGLRRQVDDLAGQIEELLKRFPAPASADAAPSV